MLSANMKEILSNDDPVFIIDSINELCEFPSYSWIKDVIDHAPLSVVSVEKQGRIIAELNRREKIAREKLLHIYRAPLFFNANNGTLSVVGGALRKISENS